MSSGRNPDICIPQQQDDDDCHSGKEEATHMTFTPQDLRVMAQDTGLRAYRPPPVWYDDTLQSGSLTETHEDVHGIREAFESGNPRLLNLARPPYAKKPPDSVLRELWDWEEDQNERLDELLSNPVYSFLEELSTHTVLDLEELLVDVRRGRPEFRVGQELEQRQQTAQFGVTPEPGTMPPGVAQSQSQQQGQRVRFAEPIVQSSPPQQQQRQRLRESVGLPSSAEIKPTIRKKKRRRRKRNRADLNRQERIQAWDARPWLERVTVMGRFVISPRARTTINYNYTRIIANAEHLNGVPVEHFMFTEHVKGVFAQLCGIYLNFLNFMSNRTYAAVSMREFYVGDMTQLIRVFQHSVFWDDQKKTLIMDASASSQKARFTQCLPITYTRINGGSRTPMLMSLCKRRQSSSLPRFLVQPEKYLRNSCGPCMY